jgi:hypothetical protein
MSIEQLQAKRERLLETIAFNVSAPEMLAYQQAKLAGIERLIKSLSV